MGISIPTFDGGVLVPFEISGRTAAEKAAENAPPPAKQQPAPTPKATGIDVIA